MCQNGKGISAPRVHVKKYERGKGEERGEGEEWKTRKRENGSNFAQFK
jgi:hypothetical protein